jgi:hypothetical protein
MTGEGLRSRRSGLSAATTVTAFLVILGVREIRRRRN